MFIGINVNLSNQSVIPIHMPTQSRPTRCCCRFSWDRRQIRGVVEAVSSSDAAGISLVLAESAISLSK